MSDPFLTSDKVNAVIKIRRGPEADRELTIFEDGELVYSTDHKRLFIGDSITEGGMLVGNNIWYVDNFDKLPQIEANDLVYRTDEKSFYLFLGGNPLPPSNYVMVGGLKLITDNINITPYTLPDATTTNKGGVIIGDGLTVTSGNVKINYDPNVFQLDMDGKLTLKSASGVTVPNATYSDKGVVQILNGGSGEGGLKVNGGNLSVNIDNSTLKLNTTTNVISIDNTKLPKATSSALGAIIVGSGLDVDAAGNTTVKVDGSTVKVNALGQLESTATGGPAGTTFELWDSLSKLTTNKLTITDGLDVSPTGDLKVQIASTLALGGIIIGKGLQINTLTGLLCANVDDTTIECNTSGQLKLKTQAVDATAAATGGLNLGNKIRVLWGKAAFSGSVTSITVAASFTTQCYNVQLTQVGTTNLKKFSVSSVTNTGFVINIEAAVTTDVFWLAIGDV